MIWLWKNYIGFKDCIVNAMKRKVPDQGKQYNKMHNPLKEGNLTKTREFWISVLYSHSSPLVFTWTSTFKGSLPRLLTARSRWLATWKKSGHYISIQISIIVSSPYKNPILYNKHKRLSSPFPSLQTLDLHKQEHDIKASGHRRNTCLFFVTYLFIIYTLNHVKIWNSSWKKRRCTKSKQCSVWKYKWFSAGKKYVFCQSIMY